MEHKKLGGLIVQNEAHFLNKIYINCLEKSEVEWMQTDFKSHPLDGEALDDLFPFPCDYVSCHYV